MNETRFNVTKALRNVFVLVVLWGAAAGAGDPNEGESRDRSESGSEEMERIVRPDISCLRAWADSKRVSLQVRELARKVVQRWDNGIVDPEPILVDGWLKRGTLDEYTGRIEYDSLSATASGTAPAALYLAAVDEDDDLLGVHIREDYVLPNGVTSSFEETYPAYIHAPATSLEGAALIPVYFRHGNHVKDEDRWQAYVQQSGQGGELTQPEIWITEPDPNAVTISVSVYDKKGHESGIVPVRLVPVETYGDSVWEERQSLKSYEERGAEIVRWPDEAIQPHPDNAALLYYRAIACQPTADPCTVRIMTLMGSGRKPDDRVRKHLGGSLSTIQLMQLASQIPQCDWGLVNDPVGGHTTTTLSSLLQLLHLQATHARTLAADGHYREALENCLVNLRFARHLGDDSYLLFCGSHSADHTAMHGILDVLATMPSDEQTLRWLRDQLMTVEGTPFRPAAAFKKWCDQEMVDRRLYDGRHPFERQWALAQLKDEAERQEAMALTDQQLLVRLAGLQRIWRDRQYGLAVPDGLLEQGRKQFDAFVDSAVHIMEGELPYKDKQARLKELEKEFNGCVERHEPVALLRCAPTAVATYHEFMVHATAMSHCVHAAIAVLFAQAQTGQLPATIPDGLPKDPFTGEDFGYERTRDGFVLRFDPEHVGDFRLRELEFRTSNR